MVSVGRCVARDYVVRPELHPHPLGDVLPGGRGDNGDMSLVAVFPDDIAPTLATILLYYREFLVISFDPILALTLKLKTERLQLLMFVLLALTIVVSLQTVGVGLAAGMLVTPGAAAYLLARRLPRMMLIQNRQLAAGWDFPS